MPDELVSSSIFPTGTVWSMHYPAWRQMHQWLRVNVQSLAEAKVEQAAARLPYQKEGAVALIRIRGVMEKLPSLFLSLFGGTSTALVRRAVEKAAADEEVEAIMLVIDSPGGSVDGLAELADAIYAARQTKPVTAQIDGMAASAGYYVASQASSIVAHRMDMVGSIGTLLLLYDYSKMFEEEGIEAVAIDTGEYKSAGVMGTEITDAQRADFQRIVDAYFADFKAMVRRGRNVPQLDELADGRVFMAKEALKNGLIDGIQTFEQTLTDFSWAEQARRAAESARARTHAKGQEITLERLKAASAESLAADGQETGAESLS